MFKKKTQNSSMGNSFDGNQTDIASNDFGPFANGNGRGNHDRIASSFYDNRSNGSVMSDLEREQLNNLVNDAVVSYFNLICKFFSFFLLFSSLFFLAILSFDCLLYKMGVLLSFLFHHQSSVIFLLEL
jgi:hypothetical protein